MGPTARATDRPLALGLGANAAQFALLVAVNALVGGMVGQQQAVLPLMAAQEFGITDIRFIVLYVAAFGVTKAAANYLAGTLSDRHGRKPVLVAGWLIAVPVPIILMVTPDWGGVIVANALLGVSQGLTWSTTVLMKIDLVGPARRGLAMGLNEAAGYGAVALTSIFAGYLAANFGLRPVPFLIGVAYTAIALLLSTSLVRETRHHALLEAAAAGGAAHPRSAIWVAAAISALAAVMVAVRMVESLGWQARGRAAA